MQVEDIKTADDKFCFLMKQVLLGFKHGSVVYGNNSVDSDIDVIYVINSEYEDLLDDGFGQWFYQDGHYDYQFISENTWIKKIANQEIEVFEAFSLDKEDIVFGDMDKYRNMLSYDSWTMRQSLSARSNNSWAKSHKKMTVEADYDMYIAKKSLWHSIRIFDFGRQIAETGGKISDYTSMNRLWEEIRDCQSTDWEYYKKAYKPLYNQKRSEMVELCPKPV